MALLPTSRNPVRRFVRLQGAERGLAVSDDGPPRSCHMSRKAMSDSVLKWALCLLLLACAGFARADAFPCPWRTNPACPPGFPVEFKGADLKGATIPADVGRVQFSSPAVSRLGLINDRFADIVVGTTGGYVVAYHANGTLLWATKVANMEVPTKPAIADIDGDGQPEIVVGAGQNYVNGGGVFVLRHDGTLKCSFTALDQPPKLAQGVYSSPALGHLDATRPNEMQIVFGSWDAHIRALHADCSLWWVKGIPDDVIDTVWPSPALYDLDGDGQLDVIIANDSSQWKLPNGQLTGGQLRAFRGNGIGELPGFPKKLNEVIYSSAAIGDIGHTGHPSIVVGNGRCFDMSTCVPNPQTVTEATYAFDATGTAAPGWPFATPSQSSRTASPALADLDGDGKLETVINTLIKTNDATNDQMGYTHVIRSDGTESPGWPVQPVIPHSCNTDGTGTDTHFGTVASPIVVDLDGDGVPEIALASGFEIVVWNRAGQQLTETHVDRCTLGTPNPAVWQLQSNYSIFSTPTAADLFGDGHIELVVGSASNSTAQFGALYVWTFPNSKATLANMPWTQFRSDARNTGVYFQDLIFRNGFD
ncbi:FG-GAP repeat domain-containing protein [Dokdonella soli]